MRHHHDRILYPKHKPNSWLVKHEPHYNPDDPIPSFIVDRYLAERKVPQTYRSIFRVADYLDTRERARIRNCYRRVGIFSTDAAPTDGTMHGLRCRHPLCPTCPSIEKGRRTDLWVKKFASLEPTAPGDEIHIGRNIQLTFPSEAWDWIVAHRTRAIPELQRAWMTTLAQAYGVRSEKTGNSNRPPARVAAGRWNGVLSAHCITEKPDPHWPRAKPHFDIVLSGVEIHKNGAKKQLVYSDKAWPESWKHTTARTWAREFRKALIRAKAPIELILAAGTHDRLSIQISPMLEGARMRGALKYCLRPMIDLADAWTLNSPETGRLQLHYPAAQKDRSTYTHVVDLDLFMSAYWRLRSFIDGSENQRGFGGLSKSTYTTSVNLSGKPPVLSQKAKDDPTRKKMRKGYRELPGAPGNYEHFDPRDRATG